MREILSRGVATNALIQLFGVTTGIVLARSLGPAGRGDFAVALYWPQLLSSLLLLGVDTSLASAAANRPSNVSPLAVTALCIALALGTCGMLIGFVTLPTVLGESKLYLQVESTYTLIAIPFSLANVYLSAVLLGAGRYGEYNWSRLMFYPVYLALLCAALVAQRITVQACLLMFVIAAAVAPLINAYVHFFRQRVMDGEAEQLEWRSLLRNSRGNAISFVVYVCYVQAPMLILMRVETSHIIGFFVVATTVAGAVTVITGAAAKILFSEASRSTSAATFSPIVTTLRKVLVVTAICVVLMEFIAPYLIPLIFGAAFSAASYLTIPLLLASGLSGISSIVDEILKGRGLTGAGIRSRLTYLAIVFGFLLVPLGYEAHYQLAYGMLVGAIIELVLLSAALGHYMNESVTNTLLPKWKDVLELGIYLRKVFARTN